MTGYYLVAVGETVIVDGPCCRYHRRISSQAHGSTARSLTNSAGDPTPAFITGLLKLLKVKLLVEHLCLYEAIRFRRWRAGGFTGGWYQQATQIRCRPFNRCSVPGFHWI